MVEDKYATWRTQPDALDPEWRAFFEGFELASENGDGAATIETGAAGVSPEAIQQARFIGAIYAYRSIGHTIANINPLAKECPVNPRLSLDRLGFTEADLDQVFHTGNYLNGTQMSVRELIDRLKRTYCGSVGIEYVHIQETPKRRWLQSRIEPNCFEPEFDENEKRRIARAVLTAERFERFLQTRFVGQKRFSLEGAETLIACLDTLLERCAPNGVEEIVMGMAHRGRLNVLANFLGKSPEYIFKEFSENYIPETAYGDGDVKYHLGYETRRRAQNGHTVDICLAANPSHLEAVDPVVQGKARARQRLRDDLERKRVLPLLIHGDAAIAGQGIVAEVFNFSKLKGYRTGGTVHLVVNNQIGFTTDPSDARSSRYCTDMAKIIEAPIFHVNGNDPLEVAHVCQVAFDYRQAFGEDVVIDMYCWRKHGHNESDEPGFTQPTLYKKIGAMPPIGKSLAERLVREGTLDPDEQETIENEYEKRLEKAFEKAKDEASSPADVFEESSAKQQPPYNFRGFDTSVSSERLTDVAHKLTGLPEGLSINRKIVRQLQAKRKAFDEDAGLDWAFAESLAFGTLLVEGNPVRLTGQDSERGTFSQRHSAFYDIETRERYVPLMNLSEHQARFCVHNSLLSEAGVLGFDYGYSIDYPDMLCIWEAQFGDFVNGAQVIIDQFLTSSESKWGRLSGLVMLLPHGYEGQGPEHSSARLERFLQACAENNIQVCNVTTPAQYFHVLRRQVKRAFKKPLIIMSPKSLLRHKACVSRLEEFTNDEFWSILDDPEPPRSAKRVILCSGKVFYDLLDHRRENAIKDAAIVRVEQFYPLNKERFQKIVGQYDKAKTLVWCQEEPQNMGGWSFMAPLIAETLGRPAVYAGRDAAASPAVGSLARHKHEQQQLVAQAFATS